MVVVKKYLHLFSIQYLNELIQLLLSFLSETFLWKLPNFQIDEGG